MKFSKLIIRNLFRNKIRSVLTVMLIGAIFFFVATLLSILANMEMFAEAGAGTQRLAVQSAISIANSLPFAHEAKIRQVPGVVDVCKLQWVGAYYKDPKNFFANFAIDQERMATVFDDYIIDPKAMERFKQNKRGALVGPELMERYKWKVGDRITLTGTIFPFNPELTIEGVYSHSLDSSSLFLRNDYLNDSMGNWNQVGTFWIKVKERDQMARVSQQVDDMFRNSEYPTETFTEKEFQLNFLSMMGNIKLLFNSISVCSIFMVILLAAITMSMSARERVTEIAVLKAIGFQKGLILTLMIVEFTLLTVIGGALGTFGAKLAFNVINMTKVTQGFLVNFGVLTPTAMTCLGVSVLVGLLAGGWPSIRAANLSVVDGLRRVV